ncbi:hypothetical protein B0H19DRAFT_1148719 [Mycena capillaripes]|nr:hypothetical protein B0H19DRAFT_1148719 [Mycena capillaripes]
MRKTNRLDLPVELEREICELAASADVGTALRLATVARRVQAWVEPIIYSRVVVAHPPEVSAQTQYSRSILRGRTARAQISQRAPKQIQAHRFIRTIPLRPASFFARHVKCLQVGNLSEPELLTVLSACTGISELAWWSSTVTTPLAAEIHFLTLRRLSIDPSFDFTRLNVTSSLFSTITHLDMCCPNHYGVVSTPLERFPSLTHYSITHGTYAPPLTWCDDVLKACPRLKILLRLSDTIFYEELAGLRPRHPDLRVVVMVRPVGSWTAQWVHDSWDLAEDIVRERRALAAAERAAKAISAA